MVAISSGGEIVTIGQPATTGAIPVDPGIPLQNLAALDVAPERIWRTQPSVRKVVSFIAREIAGLSWKAYQRLEDADRRRVSDSPAELAFRNGRRFQTGYALVERLVVDLCMTDMMLVITDENNALLRVPPRLIVAEADQMGNVARLGVQMASGVVDLSDVPVGFITGWSSWRAVGMSPLRTIAALLAEQEQAIKWRSQQWDLAPKLSGIITRPADAPKWADVEKERWIQSFRDYRDKKSGGTPIFEDGMDYKSLVSDLNPADAKDIEGRQLSDAEVASFFHVPPELVGARASNFSSIAAYRQMLFGPTLGPLVTSLEQAFNAEIVPHLGGSDVYGEFDRDSAMAGSTLEQVQILQSAVGAPWMLRSEARTKTNLPFVEGTDEMVTPMNVTEGGLASPRDTGSQNLDATSQKHDRQVVLKKSDAADDLASSISGIYKRQAKQAKESDSLDADAWHGKWDSIAAKMFEPHLFAAAVEGSQKVLSQVHKSPDGWSPEKMRKYIAAMAKGKAHAMNAGALNAFQNADDDDEDEDGTGKALSRLTQVTAGLFAVAAISDAKGFGGHDAARANNVTKKTWVTGENPRPSHAAMAGETVDLDDTFSNGLRWPGDGQGDAGETAGCNCQLEYTWADVPVGDDGGSDDGNGGDGNGTDSSGADGGDSGDQNALDVANSLLEVASQAEPAATELMQSIANDTDGKLVGLQYRLKTPESLARKIASDAAGDGVSLQDAADGIKDALRYTIQNSEDKYTDTAQQSIQTLRDKGYDVNVKNFWLKPDNPYQGVNLQLVSPEGQKIELQVHTPKSFEIKDGEMHKLYEQWRTTSDKAEQAKLTSEMLELANEIPVPHGVESIK